MSPIVICLLGLCVLLPAKGFKIYNAIDPGSGDLDSETLLTGIRKEIGALREEVYDLRVKVLKLQQASQYQDNAGPCPRGWSLVPETRKCFIALTRNVNWTEAQQACQLLHTGASLATIDNIAEQEHLHTMDWAALGRHGCRRSAGHELWIGGQRLNPDTNKSDFVWKMPNGSTRDMTFSHWLMGQPDNFDGRESCVDILEGYRWDWNDNICGRNSCALCQFILP